MNEQKTNSPSGEQGLVGQEGRPMENNAAVSDDAAASPNGFDEREEVRTPTTRQSLQSFQSLSLDSLLDVLDTSQDEASRSRIGRDSFLGGGVPLSPIPRSSEVGLRMEDKNEQEKEESNSSSNHGKQPPILEEQEDLSERRDEDLSERLELADENNSKPDNQDTSETNDNLQNETNTLSKNQNAVSKDSTKREDAIQLAQLEAGASSKALFQGLRNAAGQRNMDLIRRRDSLAAKEHERRQEQEAERIANQKQEASKNSSHDDKGMSTSHHEFRARPVPKSSRTGGLSGLPKVAKRPVTTAHTPKVASRRSSMHVTAKPKSKIFEEEPEQQNFRARPLPTTIMKQGCLSGVPKIPKRPLTVPFSPLLGARRPRSTQRRHSVAVGVRSQPAPGSFSTTSSNDSTPLGLQFLSDSSDDRENSRPEQTPQTNQKVPEFNEFKLQSTTRAKQRAAFDEVQKERMEEAKKKERRELENRIKRLDRELGELKWKL